MAESGNVTILGDWADEWDKIFEEDLQYLASGLVEVEYACQTAPTRWSRIWKCGGYGAGVVGFGAFYVAGTLGKGLVDVGRLGNGVNEGGAWGVAQDALRVANLIPVAGLTARLGSRAITMSASTLVVVQKGGNACSMISMVNAAKVSGQTLTTTTLRGWAPLSQLAKAAGVGAEEFATIVQKGSFPSQLARYAAGVRSLGITVSEVTPAQLGALESLPAFLARSKGVLVFSVEYTASSGEVAGHTLKAVASGPNGMVIVDTTGKIFSSLAEFRSAYTNARYLPGFSSYFLPNARLLNLAKAIPGLVTGALERVEIALPLMIVQGREMVVDEYKKVMGMPE